MRAIEHWLRWNASHFGAGPLTLLGDGLYGVQALTRYLHFDNWQTSISFMCTRLELEHALSRAALR